MAGHAQERNDDEIRQHTDDEAPLAAIHASEPAAADFAAVAAAPEDHSRQEERIDDETRQHNFAVVDSARVRAAILERWRDGFMLSDFPPAFVAAPGDHPRREDAFQFLPSSGFNGEPVNLTPPIRNGNSPRSHTVISIPGEVVGTSPPQGAQGGSHGNDNRTFNGTDSTIMLGGELVSTLAAVLDRNLSSEATYVRYFLLACIVVSLFSHCYGSFPWCQRLRTDPSVRVTRAICYVATGFAVVTSAALQLSNELIIWVTLAACAVIAIIAIIAAIF